MKHRGGSSSVSCSLALVLGWGMLVASCGLHPLDDQDGDRFAIPYDCNDSDSSIYPGASERCDGLDNNCDGQRDEDNPSAPAFFLDFDQDGYGGDRYLEHACAAPDGYSASGGDCDDARSEVYPGASEACDGLDNDCEGTVDLLPDEDQDGHDPCGVGTGAPDCDERDPLVYSGAEERCDGVDNNCDGVVDNPADGDGDGYLVCASAGAQPDCNEADLSTYPGALEKCDGLDNDCDGELDEGFDSDGDGFSACESELGSLDCDDRDSGVYPGADELCDGRDQDCDEEADEGFPDGDGDGVSACMDCNDTDPEINLLIFDTCDGVDNNCDGKVDNGGDCPCEVNYYGGHTYQFCLLTTDWSTAGERCAAYGYRLVQIEDAEESTWLTYTSSTYLVIDWWIGLNDRAQEGIWRWENGSSPTYTHWAQGEPNNLSDEDCAQLYPDGTWNDKACSSPWYRYICEHD